MDAGWAEQVGEQRRARGRGQLVSDQPCRAVAQPAADPDEPLVALGVVDGDHRHAARGRGGRQARVRQASERLREVGGRLHNLHRHRRAGGDPGTGRRGATGRDRGGKRSDGEAAGDPAHRRAADQSWDGRLPGWRSLPRERQGGAEAPCSDFLAAVCVVAQAGARRRYGSGIPGEPVPHVLLGLQDWALFNSSQTGGSHGG